MIQPIKSDEPLMRNVPDTVTRFEYEHIIIEILHQEKKEVDLIIINKETPDIHYHLYQEKGEIYFHKTFHSKEGLKKRERIDIEKSTKKLAGIMSEILSNIEKIDTNDDRFSERKVCFLAQHKMMVQNQTKKKVIFGQEIKVEEVLFKQIDININKLGFIMDENNSETDLIVIKHGLIYRLDLDHITKYENN